MDDADNERIDAEKEVKNILIYQKQSKEKYEA